MEGVNFAIVVILNKVKGLQDIHFNGTSEKRLLCLTSLNLYLSRIYIKTSCFVIRHH